MTTIPSPSVAPALDYLLIAIQAQAGADAFYNNMVIKLGEAGVDWPNEGVILIGAVRRTLVPRTVIGSGAQFWLGEVFDITVTASTWIASGDADDNSVVSTQVSDRAWLLQSYVETAVRSDPSLGGLDLQAYPASTTSPGPTWSNGGFQCAIESVIHVENLN